MAENENENDGRSLWLKKGGGRSSRLRLRTGKMKICKLNERFRAFDDEVPMAFRDVIVKVSGPDDETDGLTAVGTFEKIPIPWDKLTDEQRDTLQVAALDMVEETRVKADEDAKAKAEADAEKQAIADAKAKAEAKAQAEADAKAKAEADAQLKAEKEAKELEDAEAIERAELEGAADDGGTEGKDGPGDVKPAEHEKITKSGGWYQIVNKATGKPVTDKSYRDKEADEILASLNG